MNPMHKGIGVIGLATGATVLAISLLGCSTSEEDKGSAEAPTSVNSSIVEKSSAVAETATKADASSNQTAAGEVSIVAPPPPGPFRASAQGSTTDHMQAPAMPETPVSPEMPSAPQNVMEPAQPEQPKAVVNKVSAPEAPQAITSNVDQASQPQGSATPAQFPASMNATLTEPARHAVAGVDIPPPPPMPNLAAPKTEQAISQPMPEVKTAPKAPSAPEVAEQPKMVPPAAPVLNKPKMQHPVPGNTRNNGAVQMPNMQMPSTSMQMPNMRMPAMNMGSTQMNPNMGYAPRMYFMPVPMYQYGQPYAPYGFPQGMVRQQAQPPQQVKQPVQPQNKESN